MSKPEDNNGEKKFSGKIGRVEHLETKVHTGMFDGFYTFEKPGDTIGGIYKGSKTLTVRNRPVRYLAIEIDTGVEKKVVGVTETKALEDQRELFEKLVDKKIVIEFVKSIELGADRTFKELAISHEPLN